MNTTRPKKAAIIIPDGMADEPLEALHGATPLQAAETPHMDRLAAEGRVGRVQTIPPGLKPGSDIGNLSLLGYDPTLCYTGRAPLEAANLGVDLAPNQVAFRCNLVTIENERMVDYSAGHITTTDAAAFIDYLQQHLGREDVRFVAGKSYRHLVILTQDDIASLLETKCTPPHDILSQGIEPYRPKGPAAALLNDLMQRARDLLKDFSGNQTRRTQGQAPVTDIWLWGQGIRPTMPSFYDKYGMAAGIISAVDLVNGIGKLAGMDILRVPGITGYYDTNYAGKGEEAVKALSRLDCVFVHIEAPDEAGHNAHLEEKIRAIENIDRWIVAPLERYAREHKEVRLLICPDHPTPIAKRAHTADPVPFLMWGPGVTGTRIEYHEAAARSQPIINSGEALIKTLLGMESV